MEVSDYFSWKNETFQGWRIIIPRFIQYESVHIGPVNRDNPAIESGFWSSPLVHEPVSLRGTKANVHGDVGQHP